MIIEPNSNIRIIKAELELDNLNQLTFASKAAQETYFKSLPYVEIDDASYQRKDGYIRFPEPFDEAIKYTYCMYQNEGYSNKWFYAFITNIEYLNDECCAMYLETDVFQTWQFDITYKPSFIEREMLSVADDTIGANTQPENLETGDFVTCKATQYFYNEPYDYRICVAVSDAPYNFSMGTPVKVYNGVYSGLTYLVPLNSDYVTNLIKLYDNDSKSDAIVAIFMIPKFFDLEETIYTWSHNGIETKFKYISADDSGYAISVGTINDTIPTKLGINYTPKNKKLFTYPYSYCTLSNSAGNCKVYKYEDFTETLGVREIEFDVWGAITPSCSIKAVPKYYKNHTEYYDEGIMAGKLPICSWNSDTYINWLTQNALNVPLSVAGGVLSTVAGVATGNPIAVASGVLSIANSISSVYEHSLVPDQVAGNTNSGDINFSASNCGMFTLNFLSLRDEYARVIDDFFSMYGYRTNVVKLPNLNNRSNWNFVKTINCNIVGDIPQKDIQKIKDMFNNGITLWHNPSTFLDYSQTNS